MRQAKYNFLFILIVVVGLAVFHDLHVIPLGIFILENRVIIFYLPKGIACLKAWGGYCASRTGRHCAHFKCNEVSLSVCVCLFVCWRGIPSCPRLPVFCMQEWNCIYLLGTSGPTHRPLLLNLRPSQLYSPNRQDAEEQITGCVWKVWDTKLVNKSLFLLPGCLIDPFRRGEIPEDG